MITKIKQFFKENISFFITLTIIIILFNIHLPYYINLPGGTININNRIECSTCQDINGSLNMLYVSEYEATIPTYLLSLIIPNWDLEKIEEQQLNNETTEEIYQRSRLMLNNSIDNAIYLAYTKANKPIEIQSQKNYIIANLKNSPLKTGDEIISINDITINTSQDIKEILKTKEVNDTLTFKIRRDQKEKTVKVKIQEDEEKNKVIGIVLITDYEFKTDPEINLKFKKSESGSSGGLMMALSIYTKISNEDIVKGRKIAGTGTINIDGTIGQIDGIKYKIMGAHKNNIDIVLVPEENYQEAIKVKEKKHYNDLEIVKVKTFDEAIEYLKK